MALRDEELPVLNEIVRTGDETIIRTTRLQRVDIDELDSTSTGPLHFELPAHLHVDILGIDATEQQQPDTDPDNHLSTNLHTGATQAALSTHATTRVVNSATISDQAAEDALDAMIDEIVDKHIISLRKDLRNLLERVRELP